MELDGTTAAATCALMLSARLYAGREDFLV